MRIEWGSMRRISYGLQKGKNDEKRNVTLLNEDCKRLEGLGDSIRRCFEEAWVTEQTDTYAH